MSHVAHEQWVGSHTWMGHVSHNVWVMSHRQWSRARQTNTSWMSPVAHMDESGRTQEWVMSHIVNQSFQSGNGYVRVNFDGTSDPKVWCMSEFQKIVDLLTRTHTHMHADICLAYRGGHTAAHCSTLQHTAAHCSTLQHTATHCNTLQHSATLCNTPDTLGVFAKCKGLIHSTPSQISRIQLSCAIFLRRKVLPKTSQIRHVKEVTISFPAQLWGGYGL